jgi:rod shape-determining protein MreD
MNELKFIFIGIIVLYLQVLFIPKLFYFTIAPNILLAYLFVLNLNLKTEPALVIALFFGLLFDLTQPHQLGFHILVFVIISFCANLLHQHTHKENGWVIALGIFLTVILYHILWLILIVFMSRHEISFSSILISILVSTFVNLVFSFLLFITIRVKISFNE